MLGDVSVFARYYIRLALFFCLLGPLLVYANPERSDHKLIGRGSFSSIYEDGDNVCKVSKFSSDGAYLYDLLRVIREASYYRRLSGIGPRCLRTSISFSEEACTGECCIVMERGDPLAGSSHTADSADHSDDKKTPEISPLQFRDHWQIIGSLLRRIEAIHRLGLAHCDIKPQNLLRIDAEAVPCDFNGMRSQRFNSWEHITTIWYASPEYSQIGHNQEIKFEGCEESEKPESKNTTTIDWVKADSWALGASIFEIVFGYPLFPSTIVDDSGSDISSDESQLTKHLSFLSRLFAWKHLRFDREIDLDFATLDLSVLDYISAEMREHRPDTSDHDEFKHYLKISNLILDLMHLDPKVRLSPGEALAKHFGDIEPLDLSEMVRPLPYGLSTQSLHPDMTSPIMADIFRLATQTSYLASLDAMALVEARFRVSHSSELTVEEPELIEDLEVMTHTDVTLDPELIRIFAPSIALSLVLEEEASVRRQLLDLCPYARGALLDQHRREGESPNACFYRLTVQVVVWMSQALDGQVFYQHPLSHPSGRLESLTTEFEKHYLMFLVLAYSLDPEFLLLNLPERLEQTWEELTNPTRHDSLATILQSQASTYIIESHLADFRGLLDSALSSENPATTSAIRSFTSLVRILIERNPDFFPSLSELYQDELRQLQTEDTTDEVVERKVDEELPTTPSAALPISRSYEPAVPFVHPPTGANSYAPPHHRRQDALFSSVVRSRGMSFLTAWPRKGEEESKKRKQSLTSRRSNKRPRPTDSPRGGPFYLPK